MEYAVSVHGTVCAFFFAAVFLTNTLLYGSWFCLVAGSSATSEKAGDDEAKRCCV